MRRLTSFALLAAQLAAGLIAGCDENTTPESRSDAGDAPADVSQDGAPDVSPDRTPDVLSDQATPDVPSDQAGPTDQGTPVDQGGDVQNPAGCATAPPASGQACTLAQDLECKYTSSTCPDGKPLQRLCTCTDGKWSCVQDLGCPNSEPVGGTPEQRCGACPAGAGASTCTYRVETCVAADDLWNRCTCTNGTWSCTREFDCYPPNTCRPANGRQDCVTNGLVNTGNFCPAGYVQGVCQGHGCTPGDHRMTCVPPPGQRERSAACVHGQWACPIGYTFPIRPI